MPTRDDSRPPTSPDDLDRREAVLESALLTFARYGYRKTSMEDVARAAHISRPGLYYLFTSKEDLFYAAATRALAHDIAAIERVLADPGPSVRDRLLDAFDLWAGRYVGPLAHDVARVIEDNPDLLAAVSEATSRRFAELVTDAVAVASGPAAARDVAQTMISTSIGIKHQAVSRTDYRKRLEVAVDLLLR